MDVRFFASKDDCDFSSFDEISEASVLGGGYFTKEQVSDLLSYFKCTSSALSDSLWLLPISFSEELATIDDEELKSIAVHWSEDGYWHDENVNSEELTSHLLALKYASLQHENKRIFALFE